MVDGGEVILAKRRAAHSYSVYTALYANEEVRRLVERLEEDFKQPDRIRAQSFYYGFSQVQAERAFTRACQMMMNNPLAFETVLQRDGETIIVVEAKRR